MRIQPFKIAIQDADLDGVYEKVVGNQAIK
jgi:hypothetical protein